MTDFDAAWDRILRRAGEIFMTTTGLDFTYRAPGACLRVSRGGHKIERSLSQPSYRGEEVSKFSS